jgi:hypothetical protein
MNAPTAAQLVLLRRESLCRAHPAPASRMRCLRGIVWVTQEGDSMDRVLSAGDALALERRGKLLVHALLHNAAIEFSAGVRWELAPTNAICPAHSGSSSRSLAADIAGIQPRIAAQRIARLPSGIRRDLVEQEARRMRAHLFALIARHLAHGLATGLRTACAVARSHVRYGASALRAAWRQRSGMALKSTPGERAATMVPASRPVCETQRRSPSDQAADRGYGGRSLRDAQTRRLGNRGTGRESG